VALLLPAVQAAREAARRMQCANNSKQIALAMLNYEDTNKSLPGGSSYDWWGPGGPSTKDDFSRWTTTVMPFMELQTVVAQLDMKVPMRSPRNADLVRDITLPVFICPSDPQASSPILVNRVNSGDNPPVSQGLWYTASMGPTIPDQCRLVPETLPPLEAAQFCMGTDYGSYLRNNAGAHAPRFKSKCYAGGYCPDMDMCTGAVCRTLIGIELRRITDGASNTVLIGETLPTHTWHNCLFCENFNVSSTSVPLNTMLSDVLDLEGNIDNPDVEHPEAGGYKSLHPGGVHLTYVDGSVHFVSETVSAEIVRAYGSKAGGELVPSLQE
ncbi:MAG TPA: DUF1559 domain-containing protein, partial [Lacipirellula sp.]